MWKRPLLAAVLAICTMGSSWAKDKIDGSLTVDIVSNNIWRGQHLGDVSIQPELWVAWKGLCLSA